MQNSGKKLFLFIGFFVLAGIFHIVENTLHNVSQPDYSLVTVFFCLVFILYTTLIIFWIQSVHLRLLPSRSRNYMVVMALLMIFYLVLRAFKYRIAGDAASIRLSWYLYYVPMTFIPGLFLLICIRIQRGARKVKWDERILLIPAFILSSIIVTNDLHYLVFVPEPGLEVFFGKSGTYSYRITFYLTYAWMIVAIIIGIGLLIKACGFKDKRKLLYIAGIIGIWLFLTQLHTLKKYVEFIPPYEAPEIHIFTMLAIFELVIRYRLIPYNENYAGFFASLPMPVMLTDKDFSTVFQSASKLEINKDELSKALLIPIYPEKDKKLSGRQIRGGYVFWIEDESSVFRANEKLKEANALLETENTLFEYENTQKEQNAYLRSKHRIYHEIAEKMYPYQKRIEEMLNTAEPGSKKFMECIANVSVLNAYVKRKTNMLLIASEKSTVSLKELFQAVSESGKYLYYVGIRTSVDETGFAEEPETTSQYASGYPADMIISFYDTFEYLAEQLISRATLLMVSFSCNTLKLATDIDMSISLKEAKLPVVAENNDGIFYLTINGNPGPKKGGD